MRPKKKCGAENRKTHRLLQTTVTSAHKSIDTLNESMLMKNYETIRVNNKLEDKNQMIRMNFAKTTYISSTNMTLVSLNKLKKKNYV